MVYCIAYDCSNKDADKKGLSFFRLPRDHKLRLTWFKKLRLVDPPNTDNVRVCSEHFTEELDWDRFQKKESPVGIFEEKGTNNFF